MSAAAVAEGSGGGGGANTAGGGEQPPPTAALRSRADFLLLEELGEGSFSTVHLGVERATSRRFAVKVCHKQRILREKKVRLFGFAAQGKGVVRLVVWW